MTATGLPPTTLPDLPSDVLLGWYRRMTLIRGVEERLSAASLGGDLPGPVHVSIGQEATAVGVCAALEDRDWVASTHRGHGHYLGRGGDPRDMVAEVYGRETGVCHGRGGSMHVADFKKGILGAQGIVGAGIGIATGAALSSQVKEDGGVAVAFFGDGGSNQGMLLEALNLAAIWKLPLVLACENNGWSEFTPSASLTAGPIVDRAKPFGVPGAVVDGNDIVSVYKAAEIAVRRARNGDGPTLLEMKTYRTHGHVETESTWLPAPYRSAAEVSMWEQRDPISSFAEVLIAAGLATREDLVSIEAGVAEQVEDAFAFALASPFPDVANALDWAYATANV